MTSASHINGGFKNGAAPHRALIVTARLRELFGPRVIALHNSMEWPARSPDMTPCDFFLWGYIKSRVFARPPNDIMGLRQAIIDEFANLQNRPDIIIRSVRAMQTRAEKCITNIGGHVEDASYNSLLFVSFIQRCFYQNFFLSTFYSLEIILIILLFYSTVIVLSKERIKKNHECCDLTPPIAHKILSLLT